MSGSDSADELERRVAELEAKLSDLHAESAMASDLDVVWIIVSAVLVFFMQVGFAMLEVGSVSPKNTKAVLLKNIGDASLGALSWWLVGFALAYGDDSHGFIGTNLFALNGGEARFGKTGMKEAEWVFDWAFAATSVTIVSGAIAERVKIVSYVTYAVVLTSFIYPLVVHWAWHTDGWASPYRKGGVGLPLLAGCGAADFAGSAVVHMVGGVAALVAAIAVKPRRGRFRHGQVCRLPQQSPALQTLGTLILWVGWYAFNAGSTISISGGRSVVAARAVVSTTIGPSAGVLVMVVCLKIMEKKFDTRGANNGILSGLVAVTAGAPLVNPEGAFVIGVVSAVVYYTSSNLLLKLKIDDVVDAAPVHLFCGIWGMVATGLFTTREGWALAYGAAGGDRADECCGLFYGCGFNLLFANLALVFAVLTWVGLTSFVLFFAIEATVGLRVPESEEVHGMDLTRHSFNAAGSGYGAAGGGGKNGGMDAVHRALADSAYGIGRGGGGDGGMRSHQTSRAASLSSSKHGDMNGGTGGGGTVSSGKHEPAWGWGHNGSSNGAAATAGGNAGGLDHHHHAGRTAHLFRPNQQPAPAAARQAPSSGGAGLSPEAVTPSVGRPGSGYGFHGICVGADGGGGGGGGGRPGEHKVLGVPAAAVRPGTPELGRPRSRRRDQGWEGGGGVLETKSGDP